MSMNRCPHCDEFVYSTLTHRCKPSWLVFCEEYGDSPYAVLDTPKSYTYHADSAEEAAQKFAEHDYELPNTFNVFVIKYMDAVDISTDYDYLANEKPELTRDEQNNYYAEQVDKLIFAKAEKFTCESEVVRQWYVTKDKKHAQERSG